MYITIDSSKALLGTHCNTGASRAIPQRTTGPAQPSLTSVIGREPVLYGWYDRSIPLGICLLL